jgi:pimeloyl-ACP methyl ester carboxylesterase
VTRPSLPRALLALLLASFSLTAAPPARAERVWETLPAPPPMLALDGEGHVAHGGARIWYGTVGQGRPVLLLHGGLGSGEDWAHQVPALVARGHRVILVDSRGQGRSRFAGALHYEDMAGDVIAVLDALELRQADFVGWSDGAIVSLILAMRHPERVGRVFAFGANMSLDGLKPDGGGSPMIAKISALGRARYLRVAPQGDYAAMAEAVFAMQAREPTYTAAELAAIGGPRILIASGAHEEFIETSHSAFLARTIPGAALLILPDVSHFALWQRPERFNEALLAFLHRP